MPATKLKKSYFVYLLCCADNSVYTGITTDLKRRLKEHKNKTGARYTRAKGAINIMYTEKYPNRSRALTREIEIKSWLRTKKLKLIQSRPY